jgi:hypothetical protein
MYIGTFIEVIPVAIPANSRPVTSAGGLYESAMVKPPIKNSISLITTIYFLPNLSTDGPANKAPIAAPKLPRATNVPSDIISVSNGSLELSIKSDNSDTAPMS